MCIMCKDLFTKECADCAYMRTHIGEKPYACVECGRRFSVKGSLTKHMRTHTGDKPYACLECGKKYISSSSLTNHMKTHMQPAPVPASSSCSSARTPLSGASSSTAPASSAVGRKRKLRTSAPQLPRDRPRATH